MAREMTGEGRVTLFPLLHMWPDVYGVGAYASAGHFGTTAIVGYIPIPEVPDVSWLDVAARHLPANADPAQRADWILCTAWSARTVPKPGSMNLPSVAWHLEIDARAEPRGNGGNMYGHGSLLVGRMTLVDGVDDTGQPKPDEVLMKQARELLPVLA
ncbi:hypothetical protein ABZ128_09285 [Streptomyces sp. NPDC006326]|uniref:hypothetical protein n=1 Tax=Streptomyces sp. NPDC006326 TaxID=3156752 RepID=UPI0033BBD5C9